MRALRVTLELTGCMLVGAVLFVVLLPLALWAIWIDLYETSR